MANYDVELKNWLIDEIGWCGCWSDKPLITLRDYLRLRDHDTDSPDYEAKWKASFEENQERWLLSEDDHLAGLSYLVEGLCERLDLTEHGSTCCSSWLTDKGKEVLALLEQLEDWYYDEDDEEKEETLPVTLVPVSPMVKSLEDNEISSRLDLKSQYFFEQMINEAVAMFEQTFFDNASQINAVEEQTKFNGKDHQDNGQVTGPRPSYKTLDKIVKASRKAKGN